MTTTTVDPQVNTPRKPRRWLKVAGAVGGGFALVLIGAGAGSAGASHPAPKVETKTVQVVKDVPGPAHIVYKTKDVPGPVKYVKVTVPGPVKTVYQPLSAAPGQNLLSTSGNGNGGTTWDSAPFNVSASPVLKVTYSYSDNADSNFALTITDGSDDQLLANTIGTSGGTTTMVYPTDASGTYHAEVQASGYWTLTITEVS
jgi:hypothetical protein